MATALRLVTERTPADRPRMEEEEKRKALEAVERLSTHSLTTGCRLAVESFADLLSSLVR